MRLIDADALTDGMVSNNPVKIHADCAPTVDAIPVVHAHWIHKYSYDGDRHTVCSACGMDKWGHFNFKFCMGCGAKMDEEVPE